YLYGALWAPLRSSTAEGKGVNAPDPGPLIGIPSTGRGLDVGKTAVRRYSGGLVGPYPQHSAAAVILPSSVAHSTWGRLLLGHTMRDGCGRLPLPTCTPLRFHAPT